MRTRAVFLAVAALVAAGCSDQQWAFHIDDPTAVGYAVAATRAHLDPMTPRDSTRVGTAIPARP